jgi:hypothetical protein
MISSALNISDKMLSMDVSDSNQLQQLSCLRYLKSPQPLRVS